MKNTVTVDFGFNDVPAAEKSQRVKDVFTAVSSYYDRMNDLMSGGLQRCWKNAAATLLDVGGDMHVLDLACGSGDMAQRLTPLTSKANGVVLADINAAMLATARQKLPAAPAVRADGESLPFAEHSFDRVMIAFGLRNVTHRQRLLCEVHRVLKTGGKYGILEFSPAGHFPRLQQLYLIRALPFLGMLAASDADSYRYLGESILRFPSPQQLTEMLAAAGLPGACIHKFAGGIVCLHRGCRLD